MNIFPRVKVHVWGGFGSQLYALSLLHHLQEKYTYRKFKLVFHTSGITERKLEISELLDGIPYVAKSDFSHKTKTKSPSRRHLNLKSILGFLGVVVSDNSLERKIRLFPWTISIRGHYSYLPINSFFLDILETKAVCAQQIETPDLFIHYRAGDLVSMKPQSMVSVNQLIDLINEMLRNGGDLKTIKVATETKDLITTQLKSLESALEIEVQTFNPMEILAIGSKSASFIGTNSKLSLWVAILREVRAQKGNLYLPKALAANLHRNFGMSFSVKRVLVY